MISYIKTSIILLLLLILNASIMKNEKLVKHQKYKNHHSHIRTVPCFVFQPVSLVYSFYLRN
jgi:hypothetical protein